MRASPATLLFAILVSASFSACLDPQPSVPRGTLPGEVDLVASTVQDGLDRLGQLRAKPLELPVEVTINVVLVGLEPKHIDTTAIESQLPKDYSPLVRFDRAQTDEKQRSGLTQRIHYAFHQAPDSFAKDLFDQYPALSREVSIPRTGGANGFLDRYDHQYQLGRTASGKVHLVDAEKVETWLHEHRQEAGLAFAKPEYTVFFLDSWTQHKLWKDSYYWYEFAYESNENPDAWNMRAWGGTYGFLFMDYSAAPNDALMDNGGLTAVDPFGPGLTPLPVPAPEGTAYNDPPIWHYKDGRATVGQGPTQKTVTLSDRVRHALDVAVNLRILGDYIEPPIYAEHYHVNVHLWHDGRSIIPQEDLDRFLPIDDLLKGIQEEVPWSKLTGSMKTYVAPRDDPGMAAALDEAKAKGGGTYIPTAPITNHVDANRAKYIDQTPGVSQITALLFFLEGHYTLVLPVIVGGVAVESADGLGWGTLSSQNDVSYIGQGRDMNRLAAALNGINAHEIGHYFGLYHAHDGYRHTANGYEPLGDHTWSSTNTVMSYRLVPPTTDHFHRDHLARAHALQNLDRTQRNTELVYRSLAADGTAETPKAVLDALSVSTEDYNQARQEFQAGLFQDAVRTAIEARRASETAIDAVGIPIGKVEALKWTTAGVNSVGAKANALVFELGVSPTEIKYDLKPLKLDDDAESVTVKVTWNNSPASWGDFFAAWNVEGMAETVRVGIQPIQNRLDFGRGVHDSRSEGPTSGAVVEEFTLDLDAFPALRDGKTILVGGGTRGDAVNGAYEVVVTVEKRVVG